MPDIDGIELAIDFQMQEIWMTIIENFETDEEGIDAIGRMLRAAWAAGVKDALTDPSGTMELLARYGYSL